MPWTKFFWSDYAGDPALKLCSFAAQGLWMRMLCIAAEHNPTGYVAVNGRGLDSAGIARSTGGSVDEVESLLDELHQNGVYSKDRRGWIYSRRMINDAKRRDKAVEDGKKGGNPKLCKDEDNSHKDKGQVKGAEKSPTNPQKPEARDQKEKPPLAPLDLEGDAPKPEGDPPEPTDLPPAPPKPGEPRPQKCPMPVDWRPKKFTKADGPCARIVGSWSKDDHEFQVARFKAHHQATASMWADWQAVWRTWVLNSKTFADRDRAASSGKAAPASFADQVLEEVEQRKRAEGMKR